MALEQGLTKGAKGIFREAVRAYAAVASGRGSGEHRERWPRLGV